MKILYGNFYENLYKVGAGGENFLESAVLTKCAYGIAKSHIKPMENLIFCSNKRPSETWTSQEVV